MYVCVCVRATHSTTNIRKGKEEEEKKMRLDLNSKLRADCGGEKKCVEGKQKMNSTDFKKERSSCLPTFAHADTNVKPFNGLIPVSPFFFTLSLSLSLFLFSFCCFPPVPDDDQTCHTYTHTHTLSLLSVCSFWFMRGTGVRDHTTSSASVCVYVGEKR